MVIAIMQLLRNHLRSSGSTRLTAGAFICGFILLLGQCVAAEPQFTISYWCGPPGKFTTLDAYKTVKEANFTLAFPPCSGMSVELNQKMLEFCQQVGLKAVIADGRMPLAIGGDPKNEAAIDAIIKD